MWQDVDEQREVKTYNYMSENSSWEDALIQLVL